MKNLISLSLIILLFSCSGKEENESSPSNNILEDLTFSVDTVVVDPGEEIIDLSNHLRLADLSSDHKKLYLFVEGENKLSVIDLDKLTLERKIPYEKEGPNGVGSFLWSLDLVSNDQFFLKTFNTAGIFDFQGIKHESVNLDEEEIIGIKGKTLQNNRLKLSEDLKWYYTVPGSDFNDGEPSVELALINSETKEGKILPIPAMDKTGLYKIAFKEGTMMQIYAEDYFLSEHSGNFYITSSVTSDIYTIDPETDSLTLYSYDLKYAPKYKSDPPSHSEFTDREAWRSEVEKMRSQITYGDLIWDDSKDYFFRIGSILVPSLVEDAPSKSKIFLLAFDKELNLIGETEIEEMDSAPEFPFFKDGKLWSFVNVEDELGFAIFDFNF
ncbi:DUF4221 family protein [Algoriphagus zhangzhouensis]|uniref:TolB-like 6-blade propeller-like n=1 Tax=Algoriphagus zhangzhouensis TaxID=1073327 RepID=A0A1M7ZBQ1_9BACT|nr:DUF4221 family protein [Algoriphagus zhangzhouensis]TDY46925.1 uncharacterized protein DUF4221 [Algoriphagus zhangzhouensis]SHO62116.1 protein of unknown function [Algoriphagus zhangzhouensis]